MRQLIKRWRGRSAIILLLVLGSLAARGQAPVITLQPQDQPVLTSSNAVFNVTATGAALKYQWRFFNTNLVAATNVTLIVTNAQILSAGPYSVVVSNASGSVTSSLAILSVDDQLTFRISALQTNGAMAIEHNTQTGDDRGGIVVSPSRVFVTGDSGTGGFSATDLSGAAALGFQRDCLVSNIRTEQIYSLGNGSTLLGSGGGTVNSLIELDPVTCVPTGSRINLSTSINMSGGGIFSGYDRVVLWNNSRVYNIALPSGQVTDLGAFASFSHTGTESWAFWGLAEYYGGAVFLVYVQDSATIARIRVGPSPVISTVTSFTSLSDMANISFSTSRSRWYFHYENTAQFRSGDETVGSAKAVYSTTAGFPVIYGTPPGQTNFADATTQFQIAATGLAPLNYQWLFNGAPIAGGTNATLVLANLQPAASGNYSVIVSNAAGTVSSGTATNFVISIPQILTNPVPRSVMAGTNTSFSVGVLGAPPLSFQWRFNGTNLPNATNATLQLTNVTSADGGTYSVQVTNRFGATNSTDVTLAIIVDTGFSFQITSLQIDAAVIDHNGVTGTDRGGLAISSNLVLHTGNSGSGRFAAADLSAGAPLGQYYDALTGDLRREKIYSLGNGANVISYGGGTVTSLIEFDGTTGALTTNRINLSSPITVGNNSGIFAGYGQVVLHTGSRAYSIGVPSGVVADLGAMATPTHQFANSWAYWGVAENFGGSFYLVYAQSSTAIVRTRVPDGVTTTVANFIDLADMASMGVSISRGRWYFHHEGASQFGGTNQTLGFATATFSVTANQTVDHFAWSAVPPAQLVGVPFPITLTAKNADNFTVTNYAGPLPVAGLTTVGGLPVTLSTSSLAGFVSGVWTGEISVLQTDVNLYLRALDASGHTGVSGSFSVGITNDLRVIIAANPSPATIYSPMTWTLTVTNSGPQSATSVKLTNTLPAGVTFLNVTTTQGTVAQLGGQITGSLGTIPAGASVTVNVSAIPGSVGLLSNFVQVVRGEPDSNLANNSASLLTPVNLTSVSILDSSTNEADGGIRQMTFTVRLNATNNQTITVVYVTANGTADSATDYATKTGTLTFLPGETNKTFNVITVGDTAVEPDEYFFVNLTNPVNAVLGRAQAVGYLTNTDVITLTILDASIVEGNAGTTNVLIPVRLSTSSVLPVQVNYTTANGSATAGSDYVATSGTLVFSGGNTNLNILVTINGDTTGESNEIFFVNLSAPVNITLTDTQAVVTIINDDGLGVLDHFVWNNFPTNQLLNIPFPVTITAKDFTNSTVAGYTSPVSLALAGLGGAAQEKTIGTGQTTWNWPISTLYHDARSQVIYLASEVGGPRHITALALNVTQLSAGTVNQTMNNWTIRMKHTALASYVNPQWETNGWTVLYQNNETLKSTGWVTFTFSAPFDYNGTDNLMIDFSFNNGSYTSDGYVAATTASQSRSAYARCDSCNGDPLLWDGTNPFISSTTLVPDIRLAVAGGLAMSPTNTGNFTNGIWSGLVTALTPGAGLTLTASDTNQHSGVSAPFNVTAVDDLSLTLTNSANPAPVGENLVCTMLITNTGPTESFGVFLTNRFSTNVTFVSATTTRGTMTTNAGLVVVNLGVMDSTDTAIYRLVVRATNVTTFTNTAVVTRNDPEFYTGNNSVSNAINTVNLVVAVTDPIVTEGQSGSTNAIFRVSLSAVSATNVAVAYATANSTATAGSDYAATSGLLIFPPGVTNLPVSVTVFGDRLNEANETFFLNLTNVTNAVIADSQGVATIINDDPLPVIAINDVVLFEGSGGLTPASFTLSLSPASGRSVTVNFATASGTATSGSDFIATNGTATFPPGVTNVTVTVFVLGNTSEEGDEYFFLNLSSPVNATLADVQGRGTILDDDGLAGQLDHFEWSVIGSPQSLYKPFSVTLTARDSLNTIITNYSGVLALTATNPAIVVAITNTLLGDFDIGTPNSFNGDYTMGYSFTPNTNLLVTHVRHYTGTKISIWDDVGNLLASQNVTSIPGTWIETPLDTPVTLQAGTTYRVGFYTGGGNYYYTSTSPLTFTNGTIGTDYYSSGDAFPVNNIGTTFWLADLRYTVGGLVSAPVVSVTPVNTGPFTNGVWTGNLTISTAATNLILIATDTNGLASASNPFDVFAADVAVTASALPNPAPVHSPLTVTVTVTNRSPNAASAVVLTNTLPATGALFVSALGSQGSCTNDGGKIICSLGNIPAGAGASLTLVVIPLRGGNFTNLTTVTASEGDPVPANNTFTLVIPVSGDDDHDGLPDDWEIANGFSPSDPIDAAQDADGDGMSNLDEFFAGTDPHDPASVLRLVVLRIGNNIQLSLTSVADKHYRIERANTPVGPWNAFTDDLVGDGDTLVIMDITPVPPAYYRVRLLP